MGGWATLGGNGELARGPGGFNPTRLGSRMFAPLYPILEGIFPKGKLVHCTAYPWSPFIDAVCLKPLLSKSLSLVIVTSSCFLKLPVIRNVLNIWSKSFTKAGKLKANAPSMGLSTLSLYTELIMFTHAALYGVLNGHPLLTYGDAFSQAIQTAVVIILVAMGTATLPSTVPKLGLAFAYFTAVYHFLPADLIPWLIRGNLVFVSIARGSQIIKNFGGKKGAQSTFTTFCQAAGTGVKLFTTTQEIGFDFNLLSAYLAGFVLNTILLVQIASSDDSEAPAKKKSTNGSSNGANGHVEKISTRQSSQSRADIRSRKAQKTREDREFDEVKPRRNTPRKARTPLAR